MKTIDQLLSALANLKPKATASPPTVIVHDPAANEPRDLDNPFIDQKVRDRIGSAISTSRTSKP